ncbi:MAG: T9SS type A sorting domain-containing protein [Salinivirgaceae bacterium]|nr:T9SS type A sorting domain-containing protein [Salinivirgaceae bacterium]
MKRRLILLLAVVTMIGVETKAQTAVVTAGGEAGTVSFSVGQTFVEVAESGNGSLTSGVQQTYEIIVVDGIHNRQVTLEAAVYPNPVTDRLVLRVYDTLATLRYTLTDANGRNLVSADISDEQTTIEMDRFAQGVYFVRVTDGDAAMRTFKVVKK